MMKQALGVGVAGFAVYVAAALVLLRVSNRMSPALLVTTAGLAVYAAVLGVAVMSGPGVLFWPMSAAYWFLTLAFLMGFGAIYKSISLRILLDLLDRPGHADRYEAILNRYVQHESYQHRLSVLTEGGLARRGPAGCEVTSKGRRLAAIVEALQGFFKIAYSG
jgi:hypothetical protein